MKITKALIDKTITVLAAIEAPALLLCVDTHVLSTLVASDVGSLVTTAIIAYHGGAAVVQRAITAAPAPAAPAAP